MHDAYIVYLRLLEPHGLRLLAVAREGGRLKQRLKQIRLRPGDVLLLQGVPLSLLVLAVALPTIFLVWPMGSGVPPARRLPARSFILRAREACDFS